MPEQFTDTDADFDEKYAKDLEEMYSDHGSEIREIQRSDTAQIKKDKLLLMRRTIALLSSMVISGETHSKHSLDMVEEALS